MMKNRLLLLSAVISLFAYVALPAQPLRKNSQMIGIGSTQVLDTYLSAEHFSGTGFTYLSHTERFKQDSARLSTLIEHEANLSQVHDRADNKQELEGAYNFYWGKLYGWHLLDRRLHLQVGGVANALLGFIYNTSNSNNPAQARATLNIMPTGVASYRFHLLGKLFLVRYELNLPLCGIRFSPHYGQSYYEIFSRGDNDHNVVATSFVTAPDWRQLVTLDAQLSRRITLRVGYLGNMQQARINGLRQHVYTHRFLVGITRNFTLTPHAL